MRDTSLFAIHSWSHLRARDECSHWHFSVMSLMVDLTGKDVTALCVFLSFFAAFLPFSFSSFLFSPNYFIEYLIFSFALDFKKTILNKHRIYILPSVAKLPLDVSWRLLPAVIIFSEYSLPVFILFSPPLTFPFLCKIDQLPWEHATVLGGVTTEIHRGLFGYECVKLRLRTVLWHPSCCDLMWSVLTKASLSPGTALTRVSVSSRIMIMRKMITVDFFFV